MHVNVIPCAVEFPGEIKKYNNVRTQDINLLIIMTCIILLSQNSRQNFKAYAFILINITILIHI